MTFEARLVLKIERFWSMKLYAANVRGVIQVKCCCLCKPAVIENQIVQDFPKQPTPLPPHYLEPEYFASGIRRANHSRSSRLSLSTLRQYLFIAAHIVSRLEAPSDTGIAAAAKLWMHRK